MTTTLIRGWALALAGLACTPARSQELVIVTYNVENLFDADDDPGKDDFQPPAWDGARLAVKLENLARALRSVSGGRGPDVLGLCEVENRAVVEALAAELAIDGRRYRVVHRDSPDERGIDCALVYDAAILDLAGEQFHAVAVQPTRDILEAELKAGGDTLHVFMNHWPSQQHPEADRIAAARVLRGRLDAILAADPAADVVCLGDLNEEPDAPAVSGELRAVGTRPGAADGRLFNSTFAIHETPGQGTFVFNNQWNLIDHVILSRGLIAGTGLRWKEGSTKVVRAAFLLVDPPGAAIERPRPTRSGGSFDDGGFSDHLPVESVLIR